MVVVAISVTSTVAKDPPSVPYLHRYANQLEYFIGHVHSSFEGHADFNVNTTMITLENVNLVTSRLVSRA